MKLKKILEGAMAGAMVLGSLGVVSADTASSITGTGDLTPNTGTESLSGDFDVTYTGTEIGGSYSLAPVVELRDADNNCIDFRFDNWGWTYTTTDGVVNFTDDQKAITLWPSDVDDGWAGIATQRAVGMTFEANVVRSGDVFYATFTEYLQDGTAYVTWTYTVEFSAMADDTTITLTTYEGVELTDIVFTDNTADDDDSSDEDTDSDSDTSSSENTSSSEDTSGSEDTSSSVTTKDSVTTVTGTSVADLTCGTVENEDGTTSTWWVNHTESIELVDGATTTITFTNTTTGNSNWNSGIYVLYTADEAFAGGSGISDTAGYTEYYVCRSDVYGWDGAGAISAATLTVDSSPADGSEDETDINNAWAEWLALCQAGIESTITATLDGDTLTVVFTVGDAQTTAVVTVDSSKPVYLSLTGELCTLTNISYYVTQTVSGADAIKDATTLTSDSDSKTYVYEVTVDTLTDDDTLTVTLEDETGSYIVANVDGTCCYYNATTGETVTVEIADGEAFDLAEGETYIVNVDRDGDTVMISYWSSTGTLLLSYIIEDTELAEETTAYITSEGSGVFTITASLEDADGSITTASSSTTDDEETNAATTDDEETDDEDDTDTTTQASSKNGGDTTPIIPIAVALFGCAVVGFAAKKRMA